jgi:hypothetical protein
MSLRRNQNQRTAKRPVAKTAAGFNVVAVNVALMAVGIALFVGYLLMNNAASTKGFAIREVERTIAELEDERKRLDMETVTAQSLQKVEDGVASLGMVQVRDVDYLNAAPPSVAVK